MAVEQLGAPDPLAPPVDLREALTAGGKQADERAAEIEAAVRTLRNAADERLAELTGRVTELENAATDLDRVSRRISNLVRGEADTADGR